MPVIYLEVRVQELSGYGGGAAGTDNEPGVKLLFLTALFCLDQETSYRGSFSM